MSQHEYEFTGIYEKDDGLVVCFTENTPAWKRFRIIHVPYDAFTDRHVRMILSHYKPSSYTKMDPDTPIPDLG